ncbi:hypothetical protein ABW19_dt0202242 [Dactylella cylindrospora]|nr:hypothetical protein ABW19_dt0202242 [Dactylella cylindrospora]
MSGSANPAKLSLRERIKEKARDILHDAAFEIGQIARRPSRITKRARKSIEALTWLPKEAGPVVAEEAWKKGKQIVENQAQKLQESRRRKAEAEDMVEVAHDGDYIETRSVKRVDIEEEQREGSFEMVEAEDVIYTTPVEERFDGIFESEVQEDVVQKKRGT